jgi:hypothetical protein
MYPKPYTFHQKFGKAAKPHCLSKVQEQKKIGFVMFITSKCIPEYGKHHQKFFSVSGGHDIKRNLSFINGGWGISQSEMLCEMLSLHQTFCFWKGPASFLFFLLITNGYHMKKIY